MGKSFTPKYRIEHREHSAQSWNNFGSWSAKYGRATSENLETFRQKLNQSFQIGGCNHHTTQASGIVPHYAQLRIVEQKTARVVAAAVMPMFEVV